MVVLTDLTPTVLGWRGQPRPTGLPGSQITHAGRGALESAVRGLIGQDATSQVWMSTQRHVPHLRSVHPLFEIARRAPNELAYRFCLSHRHG